MREKELLGVAAGQLRALARLAPPGSSVVDALLGIATLLERCEKVPPKVPERAVEVPQG